MNLATVIVLLVVLALVVLAVVALRKGKGSCSCDGKNKRTGGKCASCQADCPLKGFQNR
ncbi:MAG: hypothetical protein J6X40_00750 [Bacteroidales bacterium]|nr:hypothetical protein [Bacteroidales bacterium]